MDFNLQHIYEEKIATVIKNLEKNNMKGTFLKNREEIAAYLDGVIEDGSKIAVGGSQTLFELDLIQYIRNRNVEFFDRYKEGITAEEKKEVYRKSFTADYYFSSSNAVTLDGHLYNVDHFRSVAAPANNVRLNRDTPCVKTGECTDCRSSDRICSEYTLIKRQAVKDRIEVIILPFSLGY